MTASLYETDFYTWTQKQAALLRDEEWDKLDWQQIAEGIESLGRHERREIKSRLGVLIMHLLKLEYQQRPRLFTRSWRPKLGAIAMSEPRPPGAVLTKTRHFFGHTLFMPFPWPRITPMVY